MMTRIGSRGSNLALFQARTVANALHLIGVDTEICVIQTKGDRIQDRSLQAMGTGIFTKALDDALISGEVDVAVHSMKDVPTQLLPDLEILLFSKEALTMMSWLAMTLIRIYLLREVFGEKRNGSTDIRIIKSWGFEGMWRRG